jgi:hypothetical protein
MGYNNYHTNLPRPCQWNPPVSAGSRPQGETPGVRAFDRMLDTRRVRGHPAHQIIAST